PRTTEQRKSCAQATEGRDPLGSLSSTVTPAALGGYAKLHLRADNGLSVTIAVNCGASPTPHPTLSQRERAYRASPNPLPEGEGLSVGRCLDAVQLGVL